MTQIEVLDMNYAKVLFDIHLEESVINKARVLLLDHNELLEALDHPGIKAKEKHAVIEKLFEKPIRSFLKVVSDNGHMAHIEKIFKAYDELVIENKDMAIAQLSYVTKPSDEQLDGIKQMICKKYNKVGVLLQLKEDASLIGGFILKVGDETYDRSIKGKLRDMQKSLQWR